MEKAVALLTKYDDFKAVCKQPQLYKHTLCEVQSARLYRSKDGQRIRFSITANRFLRGMIRLIVSFLLKIGKREMTLEEFEHVLANRIDLPNKMPAFPNGLYLSRVEYPYLKVEPSKDIAYFMKLGFEE
jgi:tRNA pseudouridine38-40 synthase